MAIKTVHDTFDKTWFITFTCFDWRPLFEMTNSYDLVYNWLKLIKSVNQIETLAFVIMPNHVHLILQLNSEEVNLNKMIGNTKRFMAYELIDRLEQNQQIITLEKLAAACTEKEKIKGQKHKVFEPSFDAKAIYTEQFLYQKVDYIHHNPCSGKWNLCDEFTQYAHSSAAFYETGIKHKFVDIKDFRDIE